MYSKPHMTGKPWLGDGEQAVPLASRQTRHHTRQTVLGLRATTVREDLRVLPFPAASRHSGPGPPPLISGVEGVWDPEGSRLETRGLNTQVRRRGLTERVAHSPGL